MPTENHLADVLRSGSLNADNRVFAHLPDGTQITYDAFFSQARAIAVRLVSLGLKPGDRVTVQVEKSPHALQLYLGTLLAGGVFQPLNTAYTGAELDYFLQDTEPRIVVCAPEREGEVASLAGACGVNQIVTLDAAGGGTLLADLAPAHGFQPVVRAVDDLAAILYTSGTTGRSKGAMLTHGNLASNALALKEAWRFTSSDVLIHALPIFHTHGLFVATNVTLVSGAALRFHFGFDADAVVSDMPRSTVLMGVPTFYTRLLDRPGLKEAASGIRLFISGSAPLLAETHEAWVAATGHHILERYGMSETNMNTSNPYEGDRRAGTVGMPLPDVEVRVTDPDTGIDRGRGEIGGIEVRGPNVFRGYWRMPEKTAAEFRDDGFFITGDLGVISPDGYLSIVGRSKDLVISGGYNVYPKEVETIIDAAEGVVESAVFGVPHPDFGEAVVAAIVGNGARDQVEAAIRSEVKGKLARFKQPKRLFFVDELPRNSMSKVQKTVLRKEFAQTFSAETVEP